MLIREFVFENKDDRQRAWQTLQDKLSKLDSNFARIPALLRPKDGGKLQDVLSPVVFANERVIALPIINGVRVPFYISTGEGGKKNVLTSRWYPFFGFRPSGWLNKGGEADINAYYGSEELARLAKYLDTTLGDLQPYVDRYSPGDVMPSCLFKHQSAAISVDMNPAESNSDIEAIESNIDDVLLRIGSRPFYDKTRTNASKPHTPQKAQSSTADNTPITGPITVVVGNKSTKLNLSSVLSRATLSSQDYPDAQFWDADNQARLQKQPDGTWIITPNPSATNATIINGRVATAPLRATSGMTVTVGRRDGSNQKNPITLR